VPRTARRVTPKNIEKVLTRLYCDNIVALTAKSFAQLNRMVEDKSKSDRDKIRAIQLVLESAQVLHPKQPLVQINQQFNNQREQSQPGFRSFESILRRLEARDVAQGEVIDIAGQVN
jgi:hypothetical protein